MMDVDTMIAEAKRITAENGRQIDAAYRRAVDDLNAEIRKANARFPTLGAAEITDDEVDAAIAAIRADAIASIATFTPSGRLVDAEGAQIDFDG